MLGLCDGTRRHSVRWSRQNVVLWSDRCYFANITRCPCSNYWSHNHHWQARRSYGVGWLRCLVRRCVFYRLGRGASLSLLLGIVSGISSRESDRQACFCIGHDDRAGSRGCPSAYSGVIMSHRTLHSATNHRPLGPSDASGESARDSCSRRSSPAAVAELGRYA